MPKHVLTYIFPCINIVLSLVSAAIYGIYKDYRMMTYWLAAAILTSSVVLK